MKFFIDPQQPTLLSEEDLCQDISIEAGISPEEARLRSEMARKAFETEDPSLDPSPDSQEREVLTEWYEDYEELRAAGWPWRVAVFIAWSASPKKGRKPKTLILLAQNVLGLNSDRVIHTWRKKNPAIDETIGFMQAAPLMQHRRDFYTALAESAADPSYRNHPDRKLALEMTGDYTPRTQVDLKRPIDLDDLSQLSEEELAEIARLGGTKKAKDAGTA